MLCHPLAVGNPAKPPEDIDDADYIGPPGPAAGFAHDLGKGQGDKWQDGVGYNDDAPYVFQKQICA